MTTKNLQKLEQQVPMKLVQQIGDLNQVYHIKITSICILHLHVHTSTRTYSFKNYTC